MPKLKRKENLRRVTEKTLETVRDGRQAKGDRSKVRFLNVGFNDNDDRELLP